MSNNKNVLHEKKRHYIGKTHLLQPINQHKLPLKS